MTRGDFILSILTSLIATILYDLTRKTYPKLKAKAAEARRQLGYIGFTISHIVLFYVVVPVANKFSTRVLSVSAISIITFVALVNLSQQTTLAPPKELGYPGMVVVRPTTESFESLSAITGNPSIAFALVHEAVAYPDKVIMIRPSDYGVR